MKKLLLTVLLVFGMVSTSHALKIQVSNDVTGALEEVQGSDGRMNVSARADARSYYNSRDVEQTYSLVWDIDTVASGATVAYWKNTSSTKDLVISSVGVNSVSAALFELSFVTGTAVGTSATATNLNRSSSNDAEAITLVASTTAGITGLTDSAEIDHVQVVANGHQELRLGDRVRLGQNDAISIKLDRTLDQTANTQSVGVIFGFYE